MAKTRVHELAQKLGLDDKDLLDKLQQAGVDAKNHMSLLEEDDIRKFEAAVAPAAGKVEEERITPGIIRRRRKEVPQPVVAAEEPCDQAHHPVQLRPVEPLERGVASLVGRLPSCGPEGDRLTGVAAPHTIQGSDPRCGAGMKWSG